MASTADLIRDAVDEASFQRLRLHICAANSLSREATSKVNFPALSLAVQSPLIASLSARASLGPEGWLLLGTLCMDGPDPTGAGRNLEGKKQAFDAGAAAKAVAIILQQTASAAGKPPNDVVSCEAACWAIAWLSRWIPERAAKLAAEKGLLSTLVRAVEVGVKCVAVSSAASYAISNLCYENDDAANAAVDSGAVSALADALKSGDPSLSSTAATALANLVCPLSKGADGRVSAILKAETLPKLIELARSAATHAQQRAVTTLAKLSAVQAGRDVLRASGVGDVFDAVARTSTLR